jgi:hypothetical protein
VVARLIKIISARRAQRTRALAMVLLACLSWVEIAEVSHHHNGALATRLQSSAAGSAQLDAQSNEQTRRSRSSQDDCLVCQLHRNLFATTLGHALYEAPAPLCSLRGNALLLSHKSQITTAERGRAPPVNL